jgi:hypothetical protein
MLGPVIRRLAVGLVPLALAALLLPACRTLRSVEQRTTQGPSAEELWFVRVYTLNGREPSFDERRHWEDQIDRRISRYLREHPEAANSFDVTTFRFLRRASVGMTKEQIVILLGQPASTTADPGEMEKLAKKYWPEIKTEAKEAWVYPTGWHLFFADDRVVDITQIQER